MNVVKRIIFIINQELIREMSLKLLGRVVILFLVASFASGSALSKDNPHDKVIASVGSKTITVKEFLERCELTIRPGSFKDRYITLNNLITEKILAIEAEKDISIYENPILKNTVKGIKEQAMRDKLYNVFASNKVKPDSTELINCYKASLREYEVEFYTIKSKTLAGDIETILDTLPEMSDEVFAQLEINAGKKPLRKVSFDDKDDDEIKRALFFTPLDTGEIAGPLKLRNGQYILLRIVNWTDTPVIGFQQQVEQWEKVNQTLRDLKARKIWLAYQTDLMKDKRFTFNPKTFNAIADAGMQYYINKPEDGSVSLTMRDIPSVNISPDDIFFSVNNEVWSVNRFREEMISHPLVFRTKYLDGNNFKREFQHAVVDMMRDHFLNREAYKVSLDQSDEVNRTGEIWKDSFLATAEMTRVIESALEEGTIHRDNNLEMLKYKESYITDLQNKYSRMISINFSEFEKISLTNVDFLAMRPGVPFPNAAPDFPLLIRSDDLEYAQNEIDAE